MARAIIIRESLRSGRLPAGLQDCAACTYTHSLDEQEPVHIIEVEISEAAAPAASVALARDLAPKRFYAHIWTPELLYVCFPSVVALIAKDDASAEARAREIGLAFDIPLSQMRFAEMFTTDHPDLVT